MTQLLKFHSISGASIYLEATAISSLHPATDSAIAKATIVMGCSMHVEVKETIEEILAILKTKDNYNFKG